MWRNSGLTSILNTHTGYAGAVDITYNYGVTDDGTEWRQGLKKHFKAETAKTFFNGDLDRWSSIKCPKTWFNFDQMVQEELPR